MLCVVLRYKVSVWKRTELANATEVTLMDVWSCLNDFCVSRSKLVLITCRLLTSSCVLEEGKTLDADSRTP